jgi:hypothetical protein
VKSYRVPLTAFVAGLIAATGLSEVFERTVPQAVAQTPVKIDLPAELESIKARLPDQAHAMQDVGYHFTNVWFAGQKENWELAKFYVGETKSHLRWAVRIIPKRKDNAGQEVNLQAILEATENGPLAQLETAIQEKHKDRFVAAYKFTLETCYACHKTSDKPYLRLQIPTHPEVQIIDFEPRPVGAK